MWPTSELCFSKFMKRVWLEDGNFPVKGRRKMRGTFSFIAVECDDRELSYLVQERYTVFRRLYWRGEGREGARNLKEWGILRREGERRYGRQYHSIRNLRCKSLIIYVVRLFLFIEFIIDIYVIIFIGFVSVLVLFVLSSIGVILKDWLLQSESFFSSSKKITGKVS